MQSTDSAVKRNVSIYEGTSTSTLDSLCRISITRVIFINFPLTLTVTASLICKIALPQCLFWPHNYYHITVSLIPYLHVQGLIIPWVVSSQADIAPPRPMSAVGCMSTFCTGVHKPSEATHLWTWRRSGHGTVTK